MNEPNPVISSAKRPTSVLLIAILILLESVFGLCCGSLGIIGLQNPKIAETLPPNYMTFVYVLIAISGLLTIYAVVCSIGMLMHKIWARFHVICYAVLGACFSVIQVAVDNGYFGVDRKLEGVEGQIGFAIEIGLFIAYMAIYAVTIFFMSRPNVKEYFGR